MEHSFSKLQINIGIDDNFNYFEVHRTHHDKFGGLTISGMRIQKIIGDSLQTEYGNKQ